MLQNAPEVLFGALTRLYRASLGPEYCIPGDGYWSPGIVDLISYEVQHEPHINLALSSLMAFDMALQIAIDCIVHGETIFYTHLNRWEEAGESEE